jgi:hypothetical protein
MIWKSLSTVRVICPLCFPNQDTVFDVHVPGTGTGAIHTVGRTNLFVILPPFTVEVLPYSLPTTDLPPVVGGFFFLTTILFTFGAEKTQGGQKGSIGHEAPPGLFVIDNTFNY